MAADPSVSPADTIRPMLEAGALCSGRFRPKWDAALDALAALLAVGERDKAEIEALTCAVEGLLDVGQRSRSGDPSLDPEEWYAIRDYARNALKDGIGVVEDIRDARERDRQRIAQLTEALREVGLWEHDAGDPPYGVIRSMRDFARAVLAGEEDADNG